MLRREGGILARSFSHSGRTSVCSALILCSLCRSKHQMAHLGDNEDNGYVGNNGAGAADTAPKQTEYVPPVTETNPVETI